MKPYTIIKRIAFLVIILLGSCLNREDNEVEVPQVQIAFSFSEISKSSRVTETKPPAFIFITIKDETNSIIINQEKLPLIKISDNYITKEIKLKVGSYKIEEFIVTDEDQEALYITPKSGSEFADLVRTPLPHTFEVSANMINEVVLEVIPANYGIPEKFGYSNFSFNIIDPIKDALLVHYPFDGNADDAVGSNIGILHGDPVFSTSTMGHPFAIKLDGSDDYVFVEKSDDVDFGTEDFTISLKLKTIANTGVIFNTRNTSSCSAADGSTLGLGIEDGKLFGRGRDGSVDTQLYSLEPVNDGNWHIISLRRRKDVLSISIDDKVISKEISADANYSTILDFYIGRTIYCSGSYLAGEIDDFKIFNRYLSSSEIEYSYM